MVSDDEAARRERAAKLREKIEKMKQGKAEPLSSTEGGLAGGNPVIDDNASSGQAAGAPSPSTRPLSPRDFIEKRMRELKDQPAKKPSED